MLFVIYFVQLEHFIPFHFSFDLMYIIITNRYYAEQQVEYVVLEAGLGGRFDSTNFVENPLASVITSISLDHQSLLGETVEEIAWHKAGKMEFLILLLMLLLFSLCNSS